MSSGPEEKAKVDSSAPVSSSQVPTVTQSTEPLLYDVDMPQAPAQVPQAVRTRVTSRPMQASVQSQQMPHQFQGPQTSPQVPQFPTFGFSASNPNQQVPQQFPSPQFNLFGPPGSMQPPGIFQQAPQPFQQAAQQYPSSYAPTFGSPGSTQAFNPYQQAPMQFQQVPGQTSQAPYPIPGGYNVQPGPLASLFGQVPTSNPVSLVASLKTVPPFSEQLHYKDDEEVKTKVVTAPQSGLVGQDKLLVTAKCALTQVQISLTKPIEVPCMISLKGVSKDLEEIERSRPGLDLVCVIDISGSMGGMKIELVRQTLEFLVTKLTEFDRLSIVIFDDVAYRVSPLLSCSAAGRTTLEGYIARLGAEGGTNIISGLACGLQVLADRRQVNTVTSIFLLSDGVDNDTNTALQRSQTVLGEFRTRIRGDFTLHTFGYGSDHDSNIMCNLADQGMGAFHFVEKLESISEAFADSFGGLVSQVGKNVVVHVEARPGPVQCRVSKVYTKNQAGDFSLPAVMANESKDFVFLLEFAAVGQDLQVAVSFPVVSAGVRYNTVDGRGVEETVELVVECVPASAHVDLSVREDVLVNFYRVKGAEILKEASDLAERRQFDQARTCLDEGVKELRASLVNSHALVLALIRDMEDAKNRVRDDTAWRMGGAAQVKSTFSNHYAQSASSNVQYYAQPQQAAYNMQFQAYQNSRKP